MENFVDVRLSAEEAELIDFALDLVVDAYGRNLEQGGIVDHSRKNTEEGMPGLLSISYADAATSPRISTKRRQA